MLILVFALQAERSAASRTRSPALKLATAPNSLATLTHTFFGAEAAMGARQNVLTDVGQQNGGLHNHNGVDWYFNDSYSWGFVAEGTGVSRNSCDTRGDPGNAFRMCWHTGGGRMNGGYRCGDRFTSGNDYQRVIYHRSGGL